MILLNGLPPNATIVSLASSSIRLSESLGTLASSKRLLPSAMPTCPCLGRSEPVYGANTNHIRARRRGRARAVRSPGPLCFSGSLSDSLGCPPRLKPRPHKLGGLGLHERKLTAIGGVEQIDLRTIRKGEGACAIPLDGVRAGDGLLTSNLPVKVRGSDASLLTVAVKHGVPCNGERSLVIIPRDFDPIKGERIRPVQRGLRALRP